MKNIKSPPGNLKALKSPPGIKDIARLAGVSIGTVDRVLHNRGRVAEETREKVKAIAQEINYRPNLIARSLVINRPRTIAVLIPDQKDEYWKQAHASIRNAALLWEQQGIGAEFFMYSPGSSESFETASAEVLKKKPDGAIMAPTFLGEGKRFCDKCREAGLPLVMFNSAIPGTSPLCIIGTDSFLSGMTAAELLHKTAPKKGRFVILHFDEDPENSPHMQEKELGFLTYLGKECPKRKYRVLVLNNARHSYTDQLRELFGEHRISGVFVSTSKTFRAAAFMSREGIRKVRLAGYDLISENIKMLRSGYIDFLINQDPARQAGESIDTLCAYLVYGQEPAPRKLFPAGIVTRTNLDSFL
ncbi:MAG: LacI family transcriptional regulator [Bacteroidales bacterium]|jgi:LacI family transcriptional regulator|nr:LacI family transcriptional regulator [Bacteroidales bacterium]